MASRRRIPVKRRPPPWYCGWYEASKRRKTGLPGQAKALAYSLACQDEEMYPQQLASVEAGLLKVLEEFLTLGLAEAEATISSDSKSFKPKRWPGVRQTQGFYCARAMFADLRMESAKTRSPAQVLRWMASLSDLRCRACTRAAGQEPLTMAEFCDELASNPSLSIKFTVHVAINKKRYSTPATSNLAMALSLRQELWALARGNEKPRAKQTKIRQWRLSALGRVAAEKAAQPVRQKKLLAAVVSERTKRECKVGLQLQRMLEIGVGPDNQSHALTKLREAPRSVFLKFKSLFRQMVRPRTMQALLSRRSRGQLLSPHMPREVAWRPLQWLSVKEAARFSAVSIASYDSSCAAIGPRLASFTYSKSFLERPPQSRSGRMLCVPSEKQSTLLLNMLAAPHLAHRFGDVDLRKAPLDLHAMEKLPAIVPHMTSLTLLKLRSLGKEWLRLELPKIFHALPQGASLECYDADGVLRWQGYQAV